MMKYIYHITTQQAWEQAQAAGVYTAPSLETEGFIHCSTLQQVIPVANAFYKDVPDLLLLEIEVDRLVSEVKWEAPAHPDPDNPPETDNEQLFPHVYGIINFSAIVYKARLKKYETHGFALPYEMRVLASKEYVDPVDVFFILHFEMGNVAGAIKGYTQLFKTGLLSENLDDFYDILDTKAEQLLEWMRAQSRLIKYFKERDNL